MASAADHLPTRVFEAATPRALRREIWRLAWPVVLQQAYRSMMFYVDQFMVGLLSSTAAMAATGVAGPLIWTLSTIFSALSVGTLAIIARNTGEGDAARSRRDAAAALALSVVAGAACTIAGWFGADPLARLFYVSDDVTPLAAAYIRIVSLAFIPMLVELTGSAALRGAGHTRIPMLIALAANLLNIFGNWVLMYGRLGFPAMGVPGAAISTAVALALEGALILAFLFSRKSPIRLRPSDLLRVSGDSVRRILRLSLPAAAEPCARQVGFLVYTLIVTGLGEIAMAAHRAAIAVESASFMPGYGFSIACAALTGQCLGAGRPGHAERVGTETLRITVVVMSLLGLAYIGIPRALVALFIDDTEAVGLGAFCLLLASFEQPFMAAAMVLGGALNGAGDMRSPVFVAFAGMWLVRIPLAWLLAVGLGWGLPGIWLTMTADWAVRTFLFAWLYRRGRWREMKV